MRLINTSTGILEEFFGGNVPEYAILSHTWGNEEILMAEYERIVDPELANDPTVIKGKQKEGFTKIRKSIELARRQNMDYIWIDTCSIDKRSSAELSEAINSMYRWYQHSKICYVYLVDYHGDSKYPSDYRESRWFSRGWTLQELIAPRTLEFYNSNWDFIASKSSSYSGLSAITRIDYNVLVTCDPSKATAAVRMSWASRRQTTRIEDMAYCLMGIFDINMPLLYGEGEKAFLRLQQQIAAESTDHTLFIWDMAGPDTAEKYQMSLSCHRGLFAQSPTEFQPIIWESVRQDTILPAEASTQTNRGYHLILPLLPANVACKYAMDPYRSLTFRSNEYVALLNCSVYRMSPKRSRIARGILGLVLVKLEARLDGKDVFTRVGRLMLLDSHELFDSRSAVDFQRPIWISQRVVFPDYFGLQRIAGFQIDSMPVWSSYALHTRSSCSSDGRLISCPPESVASQGGLVGVLVVESVTASEKHGPLNVMFGLAPDSESPVIMLKFAKMDSLLDFDLQTLDVAGVAKDMQRDTISGDYHFVTATLHPVVVEGQLFGKIALDIDILQAESGWK